ncbi:MAG: hypothetical protein CK533_06055 [Acidobacterium sp.]|nr:MAG: hypothetical protein CK533_06055 [Acidobacterium sp.]
MATNLLGLPIMAPITIRMASWVLAAIGAAALAFLGMSSYFFFYGDSYLLRYAGMVVAAFAIAAAADAIASKIVLEPDTMHVVSLMRRRSFPRVEFVSAQVDQGVVVLKRREGGWLIMPGTGQDLLSVRNTLHAWVTGA